jgi:hypothetical protein
MYLTNIELTNVCNLTCTYCSLTNGTRPKGHMSERTFERTLEVCRENRQYVLCLSHFGEPLMFPRLDEFVERARRAGFHPGFCSNGLLLTTERFRSLIDAGLGWIAITLHDLQRQAPPTNRRAPEQLDGLTARARELSQMALEHRVLVEFREFGDHPRALTGVPARTIGKHDFAGMAADRVAPGPFQGCDFLDGDALVVFHDGRLGRCCFDERGDHPVGDLWNLSQIVRSRLPMCRDCQGHRFEIDYGEATRRLVERSRDPSVDFAEFQRQLRTRPAAP